jgi:hypothetical protein
VRYYSWQIGAQTADRTRKGAQGKGMIDYRLFYPEISLSDDRRAQRIQTRHDARIFRLPARGPSRVSGRR